MSKCSVLLGVILLAAQTASAQLEFANGKLWATAQERARVEYRAFNSTFNRGSDADEDWFLLNRVRAGLGAQPVDWFKIYGELQDAREIDSKRSPNAEEDTLDWRQGWFELGNGKDCPLILKLGRQELAYGEERLIGAFDWNNVGRVFDAVKLRWQHAPCWVEVFAANVVAVDDNTFDDQADWADDFYGIYGRTTALEKHVWDLYALFRDKADAEFAGPKRQIYTIGSRFESNAKLKPWDYWIEVAGQFGHIQGPGGKWFGQTNTSWASQCAFASTIGVGYTFTNCTWQPRVAGEYAYASGDSDPDDGKSGTFDNLYPTNHKFYGFMDVAAWKNVHNPHLLLAVSPHKQVKVQLDGHLFWLAENEDSWYRANQQQIRRDATGNSRGYVGSEIDLAVWYAPHKRVKMLAGYSHFFSGDFVEDTGTHSDADFFYTQVTLSL